MLSTMHTIATALTARPTAGPTPLALPSAGSTNGNTRYISRQRTVATIIDVWNALRAPAAVPRGPSTGRRRIRRIIRSAGARRTTSGTTWGAVVTVMRLPTLGARRPKGTGRISDQRDDIGGMIGDRPDAGPVQLVPRSVAPPGSDRVDAVGGRALDVEAAVADHHDVVALDGAELVEYVGDDIRLGVAGVVVAGCS